MSEKTMTGYEAFMVIAAFRYALGRTSYASAIVPKEIRRLWPRLPQSDRELIVREITAAMVRDQLGHDCDRQEWVALRDFAITSAVTPANPWGESKGVGR
jgi:hypothetical protein